MKSSCSDLFGVYIHWPYCLSKCPYCDFASCPTARVDESLLWPAYERDILTIPQGRNITSVFFGGGTPSLMTPAFCERILGALSKRCSMAGDVEMTIEANPDAIDLSKMRDFRSLGINRLSLGVQSLLPEGLRFLGRRHTVQTAIQRIGEAHRVFDHINMDLIYARPHQTEESWQWELEQALDLGLSHYSLYQLTIEPQTAFGRQGVAEADSETAARLYRLTDTLMNEAGLPAYEVSNYAVAGEECRHNLTYWRGADYAGIGPAAHGRLGLYATYQAPTVETWLTTPMQQELLTEKERQTERLMMGLRLRQEGTPKTWAYAPHIPKACALGWLVCQGDRLIPTPAGTLMLNRLTLLLMEP